MSLAKKKKKKNYILSFVTDLTGLTTFTTPEINPKLRSLNPNHHSSASLSKQTSCWSFVARCSHAG